MMSTAMGPFYEPVKMKDVLLAAHPVGSYYFSSEATSPASLFGGTWAQVKDRFILAAGDAYSVGDTGGAAAVALNINQLPAHNHGNRGAGVTYIGSMQLGNHNTGTYWLSTIYEGDKVITVYSGSHKYCASEGGGEAHDNMPPYITAYCWRRTA